MFILIFYLYLADIYQPIHNSYLWIYLILLLSSLSMQALSFLFAYLTRGNFGIIAIILPGITLLQLYLAHLGSPIYSLHFIWQYISFFATHRFLVESILLLQYGFDRCYYREIQQTLYKLLIKPNPEYFYYCLIILIIHVILFNVISIMTLLFKMNPFQTRQSRQRKFNNYLNTLPMKMYDKMFL